MVAIYSSTVTTQLLVHEVVCLENVCGGFLSRTLRQHAGTGTNTVKVRVSHHLSAITALCDIQKKCLSNQLIQGVVPCYVQPTDDMRFLLYAVATVF